MSAPIVYDLYCGLGGWSEAFLAEGYECIGFDIEAHDYGTGGYPGKLILRDVRSIHGSELKDAAVIVASPPCQAYSYRAMPWKRAKALPPPDNTLFNECFRIQREASEAAGHHVSLIVENVRGAQKWVGRARWNYGSFYLWGDVPALMPFRRGETKMPAHINESIRNGKSPARWTNPAEHYFYDDGLKVPGIKLSEVGFNVAAAQRYRAEEGLKLKDRDGYERAHPKPFGWKGPRTSSRSNSRKAASAMIAKIPFPLAQHIARVFKPLNPAQFTSEFTLPIDHARETQ